MNGILIQVLYEIEFFWQDFCGGIEWAEICNFPVSPCCFVCQYHNIQ